MKFWTKQVSLHWVLVIGMHITGRNRPKITILRGFSQFWQGIPDNDITISPIHHDLALKKSKNEMCERISLYVIVQYQEEGVMVAMFLLTSKLWINIMTKWGNFESWNYNDEQISVWFKGTIHEETGNLLVFKKKLDQYLGHGPIHGSRSLQTLNQYYDKIWAISSLEIITRNRFQCDLKVPFMRRLGIY